MCMKDLGAAVQLQNHFEEAHSDDKDALQQIRGMFGKAKRKILRKGEDADTENVEGASFTNHESLQMTSEVTRGLDPFLWEEQELGEPK